MLGLDGSTPKRVVAPWFWELKSEFVMAINQICILEGAAPAFSVFVPSCIAAAPWPGCGPAPAPDYNSPVRGENEAEFGSISGVQR